MTTRLPKLIVCGLALAALTVAGCGDGYNAPTMPTPSSSTDVTVSIVSTNGSLSFSPNPAMVKVGQTVTFYDADLASHSVVGDGGAFGTGEIPYLGKSAPINMDVSGTFTYRLAGNPAVVGTLVVAQ
jgi:plastocyanin